MWSYSDGARWRKLRSSINPVLSRPQSVVKHIHSQNVIVDSLIDYIKRRIDETDSNRKSINIVDFNIKVKLLALERRSIVFYIFDFRSFLLIRTMCPFYSSGKRCGVWQENRGSWRTSEHERNARIYSSAGAFCFNHVEAYGFRAHLEVCEHQRMERV